MSSIHPVSVSRHGNQCWQRYSSYAFAAQDAVCPLVAQELPKALMSLPIAFVPAAEGFVPVAVLGLRAGQNLFVAPDGRWLGAYVPAAYRGYPFVLANTEEGQQVLCIDEASGLLGAEGEPFFAEAGSPSQSLADVLSFLTQVGSNRQVTQQACAVLQAHGLLQPWSIKVQGEQGEQDVTGLFRIDEAALNRLSAEALTAVRDAGALSLAYCQLLSMQHLTQLGQLAQAHAQVAQQKAAQAASPELDLEFLNQGGTISFGNL